MSMAEVVAQFKKLPSNERPEGQGASMVALWLLNAKYSPSGMSVELTLT